MTTIKDYAKEHKVSYEAVRKQIVRYTDDLEGHIFKQDRTQYLDDFAVQYLTERRRESPVIVLNESKDEENRKLRAEVDQLRSQLLRTQELLISAQQKQLESAEMQAKYELLLASNQESEQKIVELQEQCNVAQHEKDVVAAERDEAIKKAEELTVERDAAVSESQSYVKSWFGLYRKTTD